MTRIAFVGAQSTGKTTLLDCLKDKYGDSIKIFKETTRTVMNRGFSINEKSTVETQNAILELHIENLNNSSTGVNVFDRCILDWYVYTLYLYNNNSDIPKEYITKVRNTLRQYIHMYDKIFYLSPLDTITDDGVRSTNIQYRDDIVSIFKRTIMRERIDVTCLPTNMADRILITSKYIDSVLMK